MHKELTSDCGNCFGLCCVALPYAKSADFPLYKDAGEPCHHLCSDFRCSIHSELRGNGFQGCISYECFGADQHVSQVLYEEKDWRTNPNIASGMFLLFPLVQQLHEMLAYLKQSIHVNERKSLASELKKMYNETIALTELNPEDILKIDLTSHRAKVNVLLVETSSSYRHGYETKKNQTKQVDYSGANLRGRDLKGKDLRGASFIAADLRMSDLRRIDCIGADFRDADLSGANLKEALFLTQSQLNSAKGDLSTSIPTGFTIPKHWLIR